MRQPDPEREPMEQARSATQPADDRLPVGALVSYQCVGLGPGAVGNHRWVLYEDGRWYLGRNSKGYNGRSGPFESDLPSTPTRILPPSVVQEVEDQLRAGDFLGMESPLPDPTLQDGAETIIIARLDGEIHGIRHVGAQSPLLDYLAQFAWRYGPAARR